MTTARRHAAPEPAATVLRWVRAPQQARTREGLARLLEAAEELIAEKGFDDAGIVEIAQRAGSSVGGFYRRFRDKDGIIQALHERFCEDARVTADAALAPGRWDGASLAEVAREFIAFLVQIFRERQGLLRAFLKHALADAALRQRNLELFRHLSSRLSALLRTRKHEVSHPQPELAAAFGLQMALGTLDHAIQTHHEPLPLGDERLVTELTRAFSSYLGIDTSRPHLRLSSKKQEPS
jgi:AcrR family transcriptional regulator